MGFYIVGYQNGKKVYWDEVMGEWTPDFDRANVDEDENFVATEVANLKENCRDVFDIHYEQDDTAFEC